MTEKLHDLDLGRPKAENLKKLTQLRMILCLSTSFCHHIWRRVSLLIGSSHPWHIDNMMSYFSHHTFTRSDEAGSTSAPFSSRMTP